MFWQEDDKAGEFQVTDEVIDLVFAIECRQLSVDHAHALGKALLDAMPALGEDQRCAVHNIHLAGSQNGWERPDPALGQKLIPSKRTKLTIRVPRELRQAAEDILSGAILDIDGDPLKLGKAKQKKLSKQGTIFARYVVLEPGEEEDENAFLMRIAKDLQARGIRVKKALCGMTVPLDTPDGPLHTRSIMLADLAPEESVLLQQEGIGSHRHMGCGILIPHKGIEAVKQQEDE